MNRGPCDQQAEPEHQNAPDIDVAGFVMLVRNVVLGMHGETYPQRAVDGRSPELSMICPSASSNSGS